MVPEAHLNHFCRKDLSCCLCQLGRFQQLNRVTEEFKEGTIYLRVGEVKETETHQGVEKEVIKPLPLKA